MEFLKNLSKWPTTTIEFGDLEQELSVFLNNAYQTLVIHTNDDKFNLKLRMSLEW